MSTGPWSVEPASNQKVLSPCSKPEFELYPCNMTTFLTIVHVSTCVLLILVVLIQSGKGAEISASLGGSSQTVFGSSGGANFFTRLTAGLATVFMITSL